MNLTLALLIVLGAIGYTSYSFWRLAPFSPILKGIAVGLWALSILGLMVCFLWGRQLDQSVNGILYRVGTSAIIILLYVFMASVALDILRLIPSLRPCLTGNLYTFLGVFIALIGIFVYANINYHNKVRVPLDIRLSKELNKPIKIVMVSDLHLGYTIGKDELKGWVNKLNQEKADLILIAGDLVDGDTRPVLSAAMYEELNKLEARLGIYACLGNHEYIGDEASKHPVLSQTNIRLLQDEVVKVDDRLYIVGRDDRSNPHRKTTNALTKDLDKNLPIILLDHQPYHLEESQAAEVDLQLSGHTHRGQVFPLNLIVDNMYENAHGYSQRGATHYYVSSGLGIWGGKFRIGTQSEYAVITLTGR